MCLSHKKLRSADIIKADERHCRVALCRDLDEAKLEPYSTVSYGSGIFMPVNSESHLKPSGISTEVYDWAKDTSS